MPVEHTDTLIIGGGQAGLAMSAQLSARGVPHLVLERHRIAERGARNAGIRRRRMGRLGTTAFRS